MTEPRDHCDKCKLYRVLTECARCGLPLCRECIEDPTAHREGCIHDAY